jgi:uncharacterized repeat protein (TIGR01451 family)
MRSLPLSAPLSFLLVVAAPAYSQFGPQYQFFCEAPRSVELTDVDGNGTIDLIVASRQGVGLYLNPLGDGSFNQPLYIGTEESTAICGDVTGDGQPDVIGSREENGGLHLFINTGNTTFSTPQVLAPNISADELHLADLNNDGDLDLFFATPEGNLMVMMNDDAMGSFGTPYTVASLTQLAYAQAIDIDNDGDLDLVFSSGVVDQVDACLNTNGDMSPAQQLTVSGRGSAHDLDSDGFADLILANTAASSVSWQRNIADEVTFGTPDIVDLAFSSPEHLTASDLDGDGDADAIVTSSVPDEVAWYENIDGIGGFGPRQTVTFGVPTSAIATGDVDNDGDQDLFVASDDLNKVIWYTNMSNATGKIMGRVFNDINGDGLFNGNDHGLANRRVEATDLGATYTNASGFYWFDAVPAGYGVSKPAEETWAFTTPSSYTVTVPTQGVSQNNDFGLQAIGIVSELDPELGSAPLRCSSAISYWANVTNTGNQVSDVQLSLDLDDLSSFVGADPQPDQISNGVATWTFPNMQPTQQRSVHVIVMLPGSDHVGEVLHDLLHATALVNGSPISTDTKEYMPIVLCAYDPNDKQVLPVGTGEDHLTPVGSELAYHVRFQNTGNAEALTVTILDTLDVDLDPATLQVLGSSHACRVLLQTDGVLRFTFEGINLPDSGTDFLGSQGYVRFTIKHFNGLPEGTRLYNTAEIYFDSNPAVVTNTTLNTLTYGILNGLAEEADVEADALAVYPNPAQSNATVHMGPAFAGRVNVSLFNAAGTLVQELSRRSNTVLIDGSALPEGIYILRAADERGTERTTRVAFNR